MLPIAKGSFQRRLKIVKNFLWRTNENGLLEKIKIKKKLNHWALGYMHIGMHIQLIKIDCK